MCLGKDVYDDLGVPWKVKLSLESSQYAAADFYDSEE